MIPTEELAARLSDRVELVSPFSTEECLHKLHIALVSSRQFGGKVGANGVSIHHLQDTGLAARSDVKREGHLELRLTVEPNGLGARLTGKAVWPTLAKVLIAVWIVFAGLFAAQSAGAILEALLAGGPILSALYEAGIGIVIPIGLAIYLAYRFDRDKRRLVEFVTEATKARPVITLQRPRATPLVE